MSLSDKTKAYLKYSVPNQEAVDEVVAALEKASEAVDPIGETDDLVGVDGTGSNAAPLAETEDRLDAIEAKVDALIAALKAAGLMK